MLKNYLKIAFRNFSRQRGYAFINIFGLAIGLAACLVILAYVQFERSFDRFHSKADRIYRLEMDVPARTGMERWSVTLQPLGPIIKDSYPEVEAVTQIYPHEDALITYGDKRFYESYFRYGDSSFFDVFDFTLLRGSRASLAAPGNVFVSQSTARKYFGDENPIGKVIELSSKWDKNVKPLEVTGIFADTPGNAHFSVDFLGSFATNIPEGSDLWSRTSYTYLLLDESGGVGDLEAGFPVIEKTHLDAIMAEGAKLSLIPLTRIHLHAKGRGQIEPTGSAEYVYLFSLIALLIVVLACINYMNLATARSSMRAREVGVRKSVGAGRSQLFFQFMGESILFVAVALGVAALMAEVLLPVFNTIMDRSLSLNWMDPAFFLLVLLGAVLVALAAGSYPALLLSGFTPASVLKSAVRVRTWPMLRKSLVIFQFAVSIGFIAATIVIYQQLNYVQQQRLGFDQEQKLVMMARGRLGDQAEVFKQRLLQQSGITDVTLSSSIPGQPAAISFFSAEDIEAFEGDPDQIPVFDHYWVDHDFVDVIGLEITKGRTFSRAYSTDEEGALLINQTAVKALGWEEPIGKRLYNGDNVKTVIGVVHDFHVQDMRQKINPLIIELNNTPTYITATIAPANFANARASIEAVWDQFIPDLPFEYSFLADDIEAMYRAEQRMGKLFIYFALLAIIVAGLGLFGLAAFTALQRTKEIGIRKTLGASTVAMVNLLSRDYLKLLTLAFLVAVPVAYYAMNRWLEGFAYRIDMNGWIFLVAGLLAVIIAMLAASFHSIKAATTNPVNALRYE